MKQKGQSARAGDVIPYIFCVGSGGETTKHGQADKAYNPDEIRRGHGTLQVGKTNKCFLVC